MSHDILPKYTIEEQPSSEDAERLISDIMDGIEGMSPIVYDKFSEPVIAQGIIEACRYPDSSIDTERLKSYAIHSSRFSEAAAHDRDRIFGEEVVIPEHDQNLQESGVRRREEAGPHINVESLLDSVGVNPQYVLMFRATQPDIQPKLELYWTSDPSETLHGLNVELGHRASSAVILIDSLASVAENGGLMGDINDDGGVAVRQIGFDTYDQRSALASIQRSSVESADRND